MDYRHGYSADFLPLATGEPPFENTSMTVSQFVVLERELG